MTRIEHLQQFLLTSPNDCFLKHALALEYVKVNALEMARQLFEENLAFDPGYIATYYHLGQLLEKTGALQQARAIYEKGLAQAKTSGDQHAYNELRNVLGELLF